MKKNNEIMRRKPRRKTQKKGTVLKKLLMSTTNNLVDFDNVGVPKLYFGGLIMPDRYVTHLAYSLPGDLTVSNATSGQHIFAGNSCFDPDMTLTGHQPMGFDQLAAFYNKYRVYKSAIKVELQRTTDAFEYTVTPSLNISSPGTVGTAMENPFNVYSSVASSVFTSSIETTISTRKLWGVGNLTQDNFASLVSTDPVNLWYWIINARTFDNATAITVRFNYLVVYTVEFFDRQPLAQS
jgi:hypothetical protein